MIPGISYFVAPLFYPYPVALMSQFQNEEMMSWWWSNDMCCKPNTVLPFERSLEVESNECSCCRCGESFCDGRER